MRERKSTTAEWAYMVRYLQYAIREGIAPVMIEKQPSIQSGLTYSLLNLLDSHLSRFYAERNANLLFARCQFELLCCRYRRQQADDD